MQSYDGAECCELIGLYMLKKLTAIFPKAYLGLYRNDGLAVVKIRGKPGGILEGIANNCIKIFKKEDLSITVEHGIRSTGFLDVRLSLQKNEYRPDRKPNDPPVYIDAYSNHPPVIIKNNFEYDE